MTRHTFSTKYGVEYIGYPDGVDPDGNPLYKVEHVPIFSECTDERCHPPMAYGRQWLEEAVDNHRELELNKHFKPVHFGHHKSIENKPNLGKMVNFQLDELPGYGLTVFVDLVDIPEAVFTQMKKGEIPFRSVEILDPRKALFSSLALLSTQDPYHEFPNMIVVEVAPGAAQHAVAFSKDGNSTYAIFQYDQEIPMPKTKEKQKFMAPAPAAPAAPAPAAPAPAPAPADPMALIQQIQQQLAALQAKVDQMAQGGDETQQPPAASAEPGKMQKGDPMNNAQFAKLAADNLHLKSIVQGQAVKAEVDRLVEEVERQGTTLDTDSLRSTAMTFAKQGPEIWETFANHVLSNNIPPASNLPSARQMDEHDPVLEKYSGEMRMFAKAALEEYHNNKNKFMLGTTKEDYVHGRLRAQFPRHFTKNAR